MHGIFLAFLINRLDIFRITNLLLWKKIPVFHACTVLSAARYNGIGQGICKNFDLWAVPNPCILVPTESHHWLVLACLKLLGGLYSLSWLKKNVSFQKLLTLGGYYQLVLQVEVNWILKPIMNSGLTDEKEWDTGRVTKESLMVLLNVLGLTQ